LAFIRVSPPVHMLQLDLSNDCRYRPQGYSKCSHSSILVRLQGCSLRADHQASKKDPSQGLKLSSYESKAETINQVKDDVRNSLGMHRTWLAFSERSWVTQGWLRAGWNRDVGKRRFTDRHPSCI
jgi:hypothetical protein